MKKRNRFSKKEDYLQDIKAQLDGIGRLFNIDLREKAVDLFLEFLRADVEIDVPLLESFEDFLQRLKDETLALLNNAVDYYFEENDSFYYAKIALLRRLFDRENLVEYPLTYNRKNRNKKKKHYIEKCIIQGLENRYDNALDIIGQALIEEPRNFEYKRTRIKILMSLSKNELALKYIDEDLALLGKNVDFLELRAEILLRLERFEDAIEVIERAMSITDRNISLYRTKANIYLMNNEPHSAIRTIDEAIRKFKDDNGLLFFKAHILDYNMNDSDGALRLIDQHFSGDEKEWLLYNTKANLLMDLNKSDAALKTINKGLEIFENDHTFLLQKVEIYKQMQDYKSSLETIDIIFAIYDKYINVNDYKNKITILMSLDEHDQALELVTKAITKYGKRVDLLLLRTEILNDKEEYRNALSIADEALKLDPGNKDVLMQKSISLGYLGDQSYAITILEDLSNRYESELQISLFRQLMYYLKGEYHRSNQILSETLTQEINNSQKAFCYYRKSVNYLALNDLNRSLKMIDNALTINDTREYEYLYLARKMIVLLEKDQESLVDKMINDFYDKSDGVDQFYGILLEIFEHANNVFKKDIIKAKKIYSVLDRIDYVVSPDKKLFDLVNAVRNNLIASEMNGEVITYEKAERSVFFPKIKSFLRDRNTQEADRPPHEIRKR
jgi:tetratricopeptide (TPR) repeat protein